MTLRSTRWLVLAATLLAWCPALASVETELAFHRGVIAYRDGRLAEAQALFEKVVQADPRDAAATHYLGLIAQAQGDAEAAIGWYRRALELDPDDADVHFDLGTLLLDAARLPEAGAEFDRVLAAQPERARARLFAGIVRYRAGAYAEALPELERAAALEAELQPEARYYAGLCEAFLGNFADAAGAFSEVEEQSPVHPLARSAGALRRQVQPVVGERPWRLELTTGAEWDSNTRLVGQGRNEPEDLRAVLRAHARYRLVDAGRASLRVSYDGYGSLHEDRDEVDLETHVGSLSAGVRLGRVRLGLVYDLAYSFVDPARDFRRTHGLTPTATLQQGRRGVLQLYYQFQDLDYFRRRLLPELDRDGHRHAFGFNQFLLLPERGGYVRVGALHERLDTSGTEFRYDGYELSLGFGVSLPRDVELTALYRRITRDYTHHSVFEPETTRRDRIDRITTDLVLPLGARWEASLAGAFTLQQSDVGVYDYNRSIVGSYLTYRF